MLRELRDAFEYYIRGEGRVVREAPAAFIIAVLFCGAILFGAMEWHFGAEVDTLRATIDGQRATIEGQKIRMDELSEQLRGASPALSAERANRKRIISELQKFYVASSALMDKRFKNGDPSVTTSFEEYRKAEEDWVRRTGLWIRENMASGAEDFFLDGRNSTSVIFADAYNQEHNTLLSELIGYRRNLVALIQSNAWDK